jgi:L-alanine-DL-glutamate epimerase-like enolase superfamily enzyme
MIAECIWRMSIKSTSGVGFEATIRANSPQEAERIARERHKLGSDYRITVDAEPVWKPKNLARRGP